MSHAIVFGALAALLSLSGCSGGSDEDSAGADSSGADTSAGDTWYSCYVPEDFQCLENNASPWGDCAAEEGGIAGDGCPTADLYGICRISRADAAYQQNAYFYDGWETVVDDTPEEQCAFLDGRWEPA